MTQTREGLGKSDALFESEADYTDIAHIRPAAIARHMEAILEERQLSQAALVADGTLDSIYQEAAHAQRIIS